MLYLKNQQTDPLFITLARILSIGSVASLLLVSLGSLLSSWLSTRKRITQLALLRALGTSKMQVITTLTWEQGIIYLGGLLLGVAPGYLLSLVMVPTLIFSNLSSGAFYALQNVLPSHVVLPTSLNAVFLVLLLLLIVTLTLTLTIISRVSLGKVVRLNQD